jgi:hypothetical protein
MYKWFEAHKTVTSVDLDNNLLGHLSLDLKTNNDMTKDLLTKFFRHLT